MEIRNHVRRGLGAIKPRTTGVPQQTCVTPPMTRDDDGEYSIANIASTDALNTVMSKNLRNEWFKDFTAIHTVNADMYRCIREDALVGGSNESVDTLAGILKHIATYGTPDAAKSYQQYVVRWVVRYFKGRLKLRADFSNITLEQCETLLASSSILKEQVPPAFKNTVVTESLELLATLKGTVELDNDTGDMVIAGYRTCFEDVLYFNSPAPVNNILPLSVTNALLAVTTSLVTKLVFSDGSTYAFWRFAGKSFGSISRL